MPQNILIVGCGVAGPTVASCLLLSSKSPQEQPSITIVERSSALRAHGQNIDVRGAGATVIRKLGLETAVRSATTGEEGMQFVDESNRIWAAFAADKSGKVQTATSDIEILRGRLAQVCWQRSESLSEASKKKGGRGIEYIFGEYLDELEQEGDRVTVRFAKSGVRRSFDLVIGADGQGSRTRKLAFGEDDDESRVKFTGLYTAFFSMPKGGADTKWARWLNTTGRRGILVRPSHDENTSTVALSVISDDKRLWDASRDGRKATDAQRKLMTELFRDVGWESERILKQMEVAEDFYFVAIEQIRMDRWSKGRVVLVGDAGYCPSPISGMGTTLGLVGAYNLAGALVQNPEDYTAAFAAYEESMRPVVERAQKLFPGAPHIINPETAWGVWTLRWILTFIWRSGLANVVESFVGPPANAVPVTDYGIKSLPDGWGL